MNESKFDERIISIKKSLEELNNHPLMHLHRKEIDKGVVPYETVFSKAVTQIAADIFQIEKGIKEYSRPKDWSLLQEGVPI